MKPTRDVNRPQPCRSDPMYVLSLQSITILLDRYYVLTTWELIPSALRIGINHQQKNFNRSIQPCLLWNTISRESRAMITTMNTKPTRFGTSFLHAFLYGLSWNLLIVNQSTPSLGLSKSQSKRMTIWHLLDPFVQLLLSKQPRSPTPLLILRLSDWRCKEVIPSALTPQVGHPEYSFIFLRLSNPITWLRSLRLSIACNKIGNGAEYVISTIDKVVNWARQGSIWPMVKKDFP